MVWNQKQTAMPTFIWESDKLLKAEWIFLSEAGVNAGIARHLSPPIQGELVVRTLCRDICANAEIDGELLQRERVADAIRKRLGLSLDNSGGDPLDEGFAKLAVDILHNFSRPLAKERLDAIRDFFRAQYRRSRPPSAVLSHDRLRELRIFLHWFNAPDKNHQETPLTQAGLAHLWFESIQPFTLGCGVIGRGIAEKALERGIPNHTFTPLCLVLLSRRNEYYRLLDEACRDRDATQWLLFFASAAIEAGRMARAFMELALNQERLMASLEGRLTARQRALLQHFFHLGPDAFTPGLSPSEHAGSSGLPTNSVAADMAGLAANGALTRSVRGRSTRYHLNLPTPFVRRVTIRDIL